MYKGNPASPFYEFPHYQTQEPPLKYSPLNSYQSTKAHKSQSKLAHLILTTPTSPKRRLEADLIILKMSASTTRVKYTSEQEKFFIELIIRPDIVRILGTQEDPDLLKINACKIIKDAFYLKYGILQEETAILARIGRIRTRFTKAHLMKKEEENPYERQSIQDMCPFYAKLHKHYKHSGLWMGTEKPKRGQAKRRRSDRLMDENQKEGQLADNTNNYRVDSKDTIIIDCDEDDIPQHHQHISRASENPDNLPVNLMTFREGDAHGHCGNEEPGPTVDTRTPTSHAPDPSHSTAEHTLSRLSSDLVDHRPSKMRKSTPTLSSPLSSSSTLDCHPSRRMTSALTTSSSLSSLLTPSTRISTYPMSEHTMPRPIKNPHDQSSDSTTTFACSSSSFIQPTPIIRRSKQGQVMPRCTNWGQITEGCTKWLSRVDIRDIEELGYSLFQMIEDLIEQEKDREYTI